MESTVSKLGEQTFEEAVSLVKQQIEANKETTSRKLEKLEATIEVAREMMVEFLQMQAQQGDEGFVNPFGSKKKMKPKEVRGCGRLETRNLQHLKLSFPKLEGNKAVEDWIQDCNQYFEIFGVSEGKKVAIVGMHLEGPAKSWYQVYSLENNLTDWNHFSKNIVSRFSMLEHELLFEYFKQLKQDGTVEQYYGKFEGYMEQLNERVPSLSEEYFKECFFSGLHKDIQMVVQLLDPETLEQAFKKARCCEHSRSEKKSSNSWRAIAEKGRIQVLEVRILRMKTTKRKMRVVSRIQ